MSAGVCVHTHGVSLSVGVCVHTRGVSVSAGMCAHTWCIRGSAQLPPLGSAAPQGRAAAVVLFRAAGGRTPG